MLAQGQDIVITRNGQGMAKLTAMGSKGDANFVAEPALSSGYSLRKATYEEFLEITKDSEERYELMAGYICCRHRKQIIS